MPECAAVPQGPHAPPQHRSLHTDAALAGEHRQAAAAATADACVAQTCYPHLANVFRVFPTQREAFEFADQVNSQLPLVGERACLMSRVQPADLLSLPRPAQQKSAAAEQLTAAGARAAVGDSSRCPPGSGGGSAARRSVDLPARAGSVHSEQQDQQQPEQQQRQQLAEGPLDYVRRAELGLLPSTSEGYHMPEPKRLRPTPLQQRPRSSTEVLELYRKALATCRGQAAQQPAASAAAASSDDAEPGLLGELGALAGAPSGARLSRGGGGLPPAAGEHPVGAGAAKDGPDNSTAGAAGPEQPAGAGAPAVPAQQQLHEECVKVFCTERKGR